MLDCKNNRISNKRQYNIQCFRLFGGALAKVEGRARLQPSWALLLTDLLVFARVSRDRVLFVTEEPLRLSNIAEACFTVRKRPTEFRLQIAINPAGNSENGHVEVSNSGGCSPHSRPRRRVMVLRAPTPELKAVWHNLLQRQMWVDNVDGQVSWNSDPVRFSDDSFGWQNVIRGCRYYTFWHVPSSELDQTFIIISSQSELSVFFRLSVI